MLMITPDDPERVPGLRQPMVELAETPLRDVEESRVRHAARASVSKDGTRIAFTQIAGLIGRRIVCWVTEGETVVAGQRVGIIRFGSRTDVYLPTGTGSQVLLGQRTIAGETILARTGVSELIEGVAQ